MFHVSDNLFFERCDDGSVRILKRESGHLGDAPVVTLDQTLDADAWASVIASMSKGGEIDNRFYTAQDFHKSEGQICVVPA